MRRDSWATPAKDLRRRWHDRTTKTLSAVMLDLLPPAARAMHSLVDQITHSMVE